MVWGTSFYFFAWNFFERAYVGRFDLRRVKIGKF